MFNSLLQFLDSCFAEVVFQYNPTVVFVIGIILSVLSWGINSQKFKKTTKIIIMVSIIFVSSLVSVYVEYVKNTYGILPTLTTDNISYRQLQTSLNNLGFFNIKEECDETATSVLEKNETVDLLDNNFKVVQLTPAHSSFQRLDTEITAYITCKREITNTQVIPEKVESDEKQNNFDAQSFYGVVETRDLIPFNTNELTLFTQELVLKMVCEGKITQFLGRMPNENIPIEAKIINYDTQEIIDTKNTYLGDEVRFVNLPNGTYYYTVEAKDYKICVPDNLFRLEYDASKKKSILPWAADLDKVESKYSSAFKVQLRNKLGESINNAKAHVRVVASNDSYVRGYSSYPVVSDENGYLTLWSSTDGVEYYDLIDFYLLEGYYLEVCLEGEGFVEVHIEDGLGVCTISL